MISLHDVSIRFRGPTLLDGVSCRLGPGERIGLLGRNGSGKTTLMRMLAGQMEPDHGEIRMAPDTHVVLLPQDVPQGIRGAVREVVAEGLEGRLSTDEHGSTEWLADQRVNQTLSRMDLDGQASFETLSSGMKRRVLLARCLVSDPDLLLLDEPTNHLDIEAILWLEDFLARWPRTFLFVTHDRAFLRKLATRILEIDRGHLFDWSCDYDTFLERKEAALEAEEKQNALFDKKLAQEEAWIRQGIKARRTRNMGRVRALERMRTERRQRREKPGSVRLDIQQGQKSGVLVADVRDVSFGYEGRPILEKFTTTILRGDKVGIIGPNGAGKTTLLRILLGQLPPQSGSVRMGTNLQIAYFDQLRQQLDENRSVQDNVGDGYDTVEAGGQKRHIIGYLQDFLFSPERARTEVRYLSGGERNRILLAKLFAKPANVIVLDEPTNDLDSETLELLEEKLVDFAGTVLVVSHDRSFLNNVVTSTIVFERGRVKEYDGGYDDWLRQRGESPGPGGSVAGDQAGSGDRAKSRAGEKASGASKQAAGGAGGGGSPARKLSYKEQQELAGLPEQIESLEGKIADLHHQMAQAGFYQQAGEKIASEQARLKDLETQLAEAYHRWECLESRA